MSNHKESKKLCLVLTATGLILSLLLAKPAAGVSDMRFGDNTDTWNKVPSDSNGGFWSDLATPITINAQQAVFFAFKNGYAKENMTSLTVTFTTDCNVQPTGLRLTNATAHKFWYYTNNSWFSGQGGNFSTTHQANGQNIMEVHAFNDPQPDWHVIEITNSSLTQSYTITSVTYNRCCVRRQYMGDTPVFTIDDGYLDTPGGSTIKYPRIYLFPNGTEINTSITPTFSADINTGNWSFSFVSADPYGNSRPNGGVLWESNGYGLKNGDHFNVTCGVQGTADKTYTVYVFDSNSSQYKNLLLDTRIASTPIIPGDLNTDLKVDFKDFAVLADNWLQCNNPGDPNCTWQSN